MPQTQDSAGHLETGPPTLKTHRAHSTLSVDRLRSMNGCPACADQWRVYNSWRDRERRAGRPMLVAADTSAALLHDLRRAGVRRATIAQQTGISMPALRAIEAGTVSRVRAATEALLLTMAEQIKMPRTAEPDSG